MRVYTNEVTTSFFFPFGIFRHIHHIILSSNQALPAHIYLDKGMLYEEEQCLGVVYQYGLPHDEGRGDIEKLVSALWNGLRVFGKG